jgi:6-phosphogluconolactonase
VSSLNRNVFVFPGGPALSHAAADRLATVAAMSVAKNGRFLWILSGGGTPKPMYRLLAEDGYREAVPWRNTHIFWADERCVPPHHAESNYGQARRLFIEEVALPDSNVHRIKGELPGEEAVRDYARQLRLIANENVEWPRFDLTLLGMGDDGHTASLFPGSPSDTELSEPVMPAEAEYGGRPAKRITLTPRILNLSEKVLFLVSGKSKASTLARVLTGPLDEKRWPVQRIKPDTGSITWFVSEEAATELEHV